METHMEKEEEKLFDASGSYSEGKCIISQEAENTVTNVVSYHKKTKHEPATSGHPAGIQACEKRKVMSVEYTKQKLCKNFL